jgi:hypothetical protein
MSLHIALLVAFIQVMTMIVGAIVFAFAVGNNKIFQFLVHGIGFFAFYRLFEWRSAEKVEKKLSILRRGLDIQLKSLDSVREDLLSDNPYVKHDAKFQTQMFSEEVIESRRALDYAIAVAVLAGFGKQALKFLK